MFVTIMLRSECAHRSVSFKIQSIKGNEYLSSIFGIRSLPTVVSISA
jgi:hypothetical protein